MIEIKNLQIESQGSNVFENLSFELGDYNSYAILLGKKCGKTLLASALAGAIDANDGEILIDDDLMSAENKELKSLIGFYSADVKLLGFLSVYETLEFFGIARGADREKIALQAEEALELSELSEIADCSVDSLSVYQRAKLGIATTLMGKPSLLIYDDIFKGLDSKETENIAELVKMIASKKRTLLICSSPEAASKCCSHAMFICGDKVVLSDSVENIENEINKTLEMRLEIKGDVETIKKSLSDMPEIVKISAPENDESFMFTIEYKNDPDIKDKLFSVMADIGAPILSYNEKRLSLADVYHSLIKDVSGEASKGGRA